MNTLLLNILATVAHAAIAFAVGYLGTQLPEWWRGRK